MNNPFTTAFGVEPLNYIDRISEREKIINDFSSDFPSNFVYLIAGLRGCGKTVFMTNVASAFSLKKDWIVINIGPKENLLENVTSELYEKTNSKFKFLKPELSFSFNGIGLTLKGETPVSSVFVLLKKILDVIKKKNIKVLITIDEVDNSKDIKTFIESYQTLIRERYKIMLLMTGLYENIYKLQEDKSLTFLYRAQKIFLSPLSIQSIAFNYKKYLNVDENLALSLSKLTNGFAYAYQVLGYLFYEKKEKKIDDELINDFDQYLKEYVYDKVFSELSKIEQNIVLSFYSNSDVKLSLIGEKLNIGNKKLSVYRDRLIKKGVIIPISYGIVSFSLPRFKEYLSYK